MEARHDLGKRQAGVDRTRAAVLTAARELVAAGGGSNLSVGAVARRAGVSRLTIYNRFGSRSELLRAVAERLASADQLRPGCSLKEAEDVIGALTSFEVFDRLHLDGRRSSAAVADILMRLAGAILSPAS